MPRLLDVAFRLCVLVTFAEVGNLVAGVGLLIVVAGTTIVVVTGAGAGFLSTGAAGTSWTTRAPLPFPALPNRFHTELLVLTSLYPLPKRLIECTFKFLFLAFSARIT